MVVKSRLSYQQQSDERIVTASHLGRRRRPPDEKSRQTEKKKKLSGRQGIIASGPTNGVKGFATPSRRTMETALKAASVAEKRDIGWL
jgi:hypothetical protein